MVLFAHGSESLDCDENSCSFKLNIFNTVSHYFIVKGIGSLRSDKRGCGVNGIGISQI